jgi:hypothetical protein
MSKASEPRAPLGRRSALIKWLIFGVLLPLLPFAARALAAWVDNSSSTLSFNSLLSDGELLVVATVIAAAVIGDLLFDFSGSGEKREQGTRALLCALALVAVIASVLMFGLVTLNNQHRTDSFNQAQEEVTFISSGRTALQAEGAEAQTQYNADSLDAQRLAQQIASVQNDEAAYVATSKGAKNGPQYKALQQQATFLQQEEAAARARAAQDYSRSRDLADQTVIQQKTAEQVFVASAENLDVGEKQASYMSIIMFLIAFSIGLYTYLQPRAEEKQPASSG